MSDPRNDKLTDQTGGCSAALLLVLLAELSRTLERELAKVTQERDSLLSAATMGEKGMLARIDALQSALVEARRQAEVITQECVALRRARAEMHDGLDAVYQKYSHLDYLRYKAELDPWHECVRNFMGAVAIALGYEPKAAQSVKGGDQ